MAEKEIAEESSTVSSDEGLILFDETEDMGDEDEESQEEVTLEDAPDAGDLPAPGEGVALKSEEEGDDDGEEEAEAETEEAEAETEGSVSVEDRVSELTKAKDALTEDVKRLRARAQEAERAAEEVRRRFETEDQQRAEAREREIQSKLESGDLDPTEHEVTQLKAELEEIRSWREQEQVRGQILAAAPVIVQHENSFREQTPDYDDAVRFLHSQVRPQILARGYKDWEVDQVLASHDFGFAVNQLNAGINPAQAIYEAAVQKGYKPRARDTSGTAENGAGAVDQTEEVSGSGEKGSEAPASSGGLARAAAEAGVTGRRRSLSNSSGGVAPGGRGQKVTPAKFEKMEEAEKREFLGWLQRNPDMDERFEVDGAVYWPT